MNAENDTEAGALAGLRIIDLTESLPGPYASQVFVDLGADVIKVERPVSGDSGRAFSPGLFSSVNRGKRSLALNLKSEEGRTVLHRLAAQADVLIEGWRPGVAQRLGISYEALRAANPRLIYASLSGYGQHGPNAQRAGHDINYLGAAGIVGLSGTPSGPPVHDFGIPVGDFGGSMFAIVAILAALLARASSGAGQYLDVSISDALVSWMSPRIGVHQAGSSADGAAFKRELLTRPGYGVFKTADGQHLTLAALETPFWRRMVKALDLAEFSGPQFDDHHVRTEQVDGITTALAERIGSRPLAHWEAVLAQHDVPFGTVPDLPALLSDPHFRARGLFIEGEGGPFVRFPVPMAGVSGTVRPVPALGKHTDGILDELGYDASEIARLHAMGII